jgi:hypothetical protein
VVDLTTGAVKKLGLGSTLAYFNPGCGAGEAAVLTQAGQDLGKTRLHWLDTATGKVSRRAELAGQATSAVPVGDGIVTAYGRGLVRIDPAGRRSTFAATGGLPFDVHPVADGGVVFLEQHAERAVARRAAAGPAGRAGRVTDLAAGPLTQMHLSAGTGGRTYLTGKPDRVGPLPAGVSRVDAPVRAEVSTRGQLAVTHVAARAGDRIPAELAPVRDRPSPVRLRAAVPRTRRSVEFRLTPTARPSRHAAQGTTPGPRAPTGDVSTQSAADEPYDSDRTCAVPRNDALVKAYQPHWNQVEWAADRAVLDGLHISRPANWKGSGLPAWSPQDMFRNVQLEGGGTVPPPILLGVLTQESNLWQASNHAVEGLTGNPLVGNFYGLARGSADEWAIHWDKSDCGYGVGQVTDGMKVSDTSRSANEKRAIAVDYASNVAASLRILEQKWNQTRHAGIIINDGDARWPENWWAAVWAYNTGMNPGPLTGNTTGCEPGPSCTDGAGNWGLGYTNNLANASYPRNREPFLSGDPDDARNPQWWSYPEKVLGWAAFPIIKVELTDPDTWHPGFGAAWWNTAADRLDAIRPPLNLFCNANDHCDITRTGEACTLSNFHCWWNRPATWKNNCSTLCGHSTSSYDTGDAEPAGRESTNYPPECGRGPLPQNAIIVDDTTAPPVRACDRPNLSGTFGFQFTPDSTGKYRAKIDLHQIGAGWGDHFWFGHTYDLNNFVMETKGIWTPNLPGTGWYRVLVHLPDHGAHTRTARYDIRLADGTTRYRVLNQFNQDHRDTWAHLGSFRLGPGSNVSLSNEYARGDGTWDVAYDAIAFVPLAGKPYTYVAIGDSYSSGEGNEPYEAGSAFTWHGSEDRCHRSGQAYPRLVTRGGVNIADHSNGTEPYEFHFQACAGASMVSLTDDAIDGPGENVGENTRWREEDWTSGEAQQLERGYLDADTDLVTLTIGGNDMSYQDVISGCVLSTTNCLGDDWYLTRRGVVDPRPLREYQPHLIGLAAAKLRVTYQKIVQLAPNARVVVVGYPRLFSISDSHGPLCNVGSLLPSDVLRWLNDMTDLFGDTAAGVVTELQQAGKNIHYVSANAQFEGHRLCDLESYLYDVVLTTDRLSWLHPKAQGQQAYAAVAQIGIG